MSDKIYLRTATADREYAWYRVGKDVERSADSTFWQAVEGLLPDDVPSVAVLTTPSGTVICAVTGLLSPRRAQSRQVFDAWAFETEGPVLSSLQLRILELYAEDEAGAKLAPLSGCVLEKEQEDICIDSEALTRLLASLVTDPIPLPGEVPVLLPEGVFRDSLEARQRLVYGLNRALESGGEARVLAIMTHYRALRELVGRACWALTDHSTAPEVEAIAPTATQQGDGGGTVAPMNHAGQTRPPLPANLVGWLLAASAAGLLLVLILFFCRDRH